MTNFTKQKPPLWFWIVSFFALLWNALGVSEYLHQAYKTDYFYSKFPDPKVLEIVLNTPIWVMAGFATAVIFGALGCVMLILRKKWAQPFFIISLIGILTQMFYNIFLSRSIEIYGLSAIIFPIFVVVLGMALLFLSRAAIRKHWIN